MRSSKWMKFLLIALSAVMVLSLFACGNGGGEEETTVDNTNDETTVVNDETTVADDETTVADDDETTVCDGDCTTTAETTVEETTEEITTEEETTIPVEAPDLPMYTNAENLWYQIVATNNEEPFSNITLAEDNSYVTVTNSAHHESYFHLFSENYMVTGQYLVIKYRTNFAGYVQIYSATEGWITCSMERPAYINDGEWHIMVVDLSKFDWNNDGNGKFEPNEDGDYAVRILRADLFNDNTDPADTKSIDIAYMAMCGDDDMLELAVGEEDVTYYTVYSDGIKKNYDLEGNEVNIAPFDIYLTASDLAGWTNVTGIASKVLSDDGSYVTFAPDASLPEGLLNNLYTGTAVTGRYAVLKYRIPTNSVSNSKYIRVYTSSTNAGPTGGDNFSVNVVADGQWHVVIIDLANSATVTPDGDGNYAVKYVRMDIFPTDPDNVPTLTADDRIDIAYFGITDSYTAIADHGTSAHGFADVSVPFTFEGTANDTAVATNEDDGPIFATKLNASSVVLKGTFTHGECIESVGAFGNILLADGTYASWVPTDLAAGHTFDLSAYAGQTVTIVIASVPAETASVYGASIILELVVEVPAA